MIPEQLRLKRTNYCTIATSPALNCLDWEQRLSLQSVHPAVMPKIVIKENKTTKVLKRKGRHLLAVCEAEHQQTAMKDWQKYWGKYFATDSCKCGLTQARRRWQPSVPVWALWSRSRRETIQFLKFYQSDRLLWTQTITWARQTKFVVCSIVCDSTLRGISLCVWGIYTFFLLF